MFGDVESCLHSGSEIISFSLCHGQEVYIDLQGFVSFEGKERSEFARFAFLVVGLRGGAIGFGEMNLTAAGCDVTVAFDLGKGGRSWLFTFRFLG